MTEHYFWVVKNEDGAYMTEMAWTVLNGPKLAIRSSFYEMWVGPWPLKDANGKPAKAASDPKQGPVSKDQTSWAIKEFTSPRKARHAAQAFKGAKVYRVTTKLKPIKLKLTPEPQKNRDVHTEHCCVRHGCKYGKPDCPVETKKKRQSYHCESCDYEA